MLKFELQSANWTLESDGLENGILFSDFNLMVVYLYFF